MSVVLVPLGPFPARELNTRLAIAPCQLRSGDVRLTDRLIDARTVNVRHAFTEDNSHERPSNVDETVAWVAEPLGYESILIFGRPVAILLKEQEHVLVSLMLTEGRINVSGGGNRLAGDRDCRWIEIIAVSDRFGIPLVIAQLRELLPHLIDHLDPIEDKAGASMVSAVVRPHARPRET